MRTITLLILLAITGCIAQPKIKERQASVELEHISEKNQTTISAKVSMKW